jgi:hypothetical protein
LHHLPSLCCPWWKQAPFFGQFGLDPVAAGLPGAGCIKLPLRIVGRISDNPQSTFMNIGDAMITIIKKISVDLLTLAYNARFKNVRAGIIKDLLIFALIQGIGHTIRVFAAHDKLPFFIARPVSYDGLIFCALSSSIKVLLSIFYNIARAWVDHTATATHRLPITSTMHGQNKVKFYPL